jgi:hypothetical protein
LELVRLRLSWQNPLRHKSKNDIDAISFIFLARFAVKSTLILFSWKLWLTSGYIVVKSFKLPISKIFPVFIK